MVILMVDHSRVVQTLWQRTAHRGGLDPAVASDGAQGLEILSQRHVSLVCVSQTLPDMDGLAFCRQVRAHATASDVPVILLTSAGDKEIRREAFEAGVSDVQSKDDIDALFRQAAQMARERSPSSVGRVLYVEDSPTVAAVLLRILRAMDLIVDHHASAQRASEAFRDHAYDLVITDLTLEGEMSGFALIDHIRYGDHDRHDVPILVSTGDTDPVHRADLFRLGVNDIIGKPVVEQEVRSRVGSLVMNRQLLDRVQAHSNLYQIAMTDSLTGLNNRNSLNEFVSKACTEANRHDLDLSVVLFDLDHFKRINDVHGHLVGDDVLAEVGQHLAHSCRREDFAVRFGGEELLLVLTHCDLANAARRAEYLRATLAGLRPAGVSITASFGVAARAPGEQADLQTLLRRADRALYEAKAAGRNCVKISPGEIADTPATYAA